ncbi:hypothetical protein FA13DRAFT_804193 [Coprinellus micaceus]|uniref:Uncharacterized protein n=1 Tax=Coprinellus micaceus TaxID=71717 RepID=A0A4Y7T3Y0_COPMI|nr:hypothetical protein FA13DRAFT_804193 [Coprinellus micaceus]
MRPRRVLSSPSPSPAVPCPSPYPPPSTPSSLHASPAKVSSYVSWKRSISSVKPLRWTSVVARGRGRWIGDGTGRRGEERADRGKEPFDDA